MKLCPCRVSPSLSFLTMPIAYSDCCQPYHDSLYKDNTDKAGGLEADNAERLMRTRYSAFVLLKADYIVKTTLPAQQILLDVKAIEKWAKKTNWTGLEILSHIAKIGKRHAQVEFKAYYTTTEGTKSHHELSTFVKVSDKSADDKGERWYFLDPTLSMTVSQKQPCICGSGEKFKRCCRGYFS